MFREKKEEMSFFSNTRKKKFIKEMNKALEESKHLTKKQFNEVEELFK